MPELVGLSHVDLTVHNAAESAAWYERVLGLRKVADTKQGEDDLADPVVRAINLVDQSGSLVLGLIQHKTADEERFLESRVGLDHLSFAVATRAELESWAEHLNELGVPHSEISDHWYGSVVVFRDPDNI